MKKLILLLVSGVLMLQAWQIQDDPYYKHKKSQFEMLQNNDKYETMMLGDSITDEGRWDELLNNDKVQNRGISGDTTNGVLERLDSINKNIKQVFIMIGVNDIMRGKEVDEVYNNYLKIIKTFKDKNIKVYIQSTLFIGERRMENFNFKVEELNKRLEKYAKENHITFINLNPIFAPKKVLEKKFTFDDLHLNGSAYELWAKEIKKYF
ncbi:MULTISPECIES: GDSL-type esterase/lipase family protein [Arcobacter]|uniref:Sialate O-acetylesterase-like protein n=1 Tax=Arcobacter defluvii TaxID=873191 RepID=A0AAE7BIU8_9BACT|nr:MULTISPECIES: GDSL-type esterase/lipase family protein [Arcobacter]QKF78752.1 sialate O-acetylesterase-like protein [Arcobacter defluvii]RXI33938.1 lipolytic protein [Arcobacter defluvii]BAK74526.1 lipolytic protein [Arcobacter sp. L]